MAYFIFDLDGTVICSKHRQNTKPDGSLDLDHWMENCTREKILDDRLLPLSRSMRALYAIGHTIVICTARTWTQWDMLYLNLNGLPYHELLHRMQHPEWETVGDGKLKVDLLTDYFKAQGFNSVAEARPIMWDDNLKVIEALSAIGVHMYDATKANAELERKWINSAKAA